MGLVWLYEGAAFPARTIPQCETAPANISWSSLVGKSVSSSALAVKSPAMLVGAPALGATSSSVTASMEVGKYFTTKPESDMQTHSTKKQLPPASQGDHCVGMPLSQSVWCVKT
jgi:hypothetical protein